MVDLEDLKAKALEATPGEWTLRDRGVICGGPLVQYFKGQGRPQIVMCCGGEHIGHEQKTANERFIAAAHPDAVLRLIDRLEKSEAERDALKADVHGWEVYVGKLLGSLPLGDIIPASSSLKDFSDRLGKMVTENYSLRNEVAALKAELEAAKDKLNKAQELADWHQSHRSFAESQLEAARKQEPIIIRTMEGFEFLKTYEIGTKLYASPVPAQQECTFHGADAQACMDYSKEVPCEFTWEQEAKRAFWCGLEIGAAFGSCAILPRWNEYIEKRKSELKGGENER